MIKKLKLATLVATAVLVTACNDSNNNNSSADTRSVDAVFTDLVVLGDDFVYEGWLITPSGPVSAGRFESEGETTSFSFDASVEDTEVATTYVLTIEPAEGDDPAPAPTHVLAGDFISDEAALTISHPAALATDFTTASGTFVLAAPTADDVGGFENGIWWLQAPGPTASLTLPELPEGWVYEGWVVDGSEGGTGPTTTGRFVVPEGADSDGAGPTAGPLVEDAPPFPGQDFIDPLVNLVGLTAVITVEPEPDNSEGPYAIIPLTGAIASVAPVGGAPSSQLMELAIGEDGNQPSGDVVIQ